MKVNIIGPGHMTKMAAMPINSKNLYKSYCSVILKLCLKHLVNGALQSLYKS